MADPDAGFVNGMILEARILAPDGRESSVPLPQIAPGRYAAEFPVPASGTYVVPIVSAGTVLDTALLSIPYPEEYLMMTPDLDFLGDVAGMTGEGFSGSTPPRTRTSMNRIPEAARSGSRCGRCSSSRDSSSTSPRSCSASTRRPAPQACRIAARKLLASREKKETLTYGQLRGKSKRSGSRGRRRNPISPTGSARTGPRRTLCGCTSRRSGKTAKGKVMKRIDEVNRQILNILQENGTITNAELASKVGMAPPTVLERVKKLERQGIIKKYVAIVDESRIGRGVIVFVAISVADHTSHGIKNFNKEIQKLRRFSSATISRARRITSSRSSQRTSRTTRPSRSRSWRLSRTSGGSAPCSSSRP
jgi:DNA-binding Lrp family transcriptional regulator